MKYPTRSKTKQQSPAAKLQRENANLRAKLAHAEKLARAIMKNTAEAIVVCDDKHRIIRANHAASDLCGGDPLGKLFQTAFPLHGVDGKPILLSDNCSRKEWQGVEVKLQRDSREFALLISIGPFQRKRNEPLGWVITLFDISKRRATESALVLSTQRYATTLASIGDAVIATDIAGNITFMNPVAERLTGWTLTKAYQKPATEIFHIINEQTHEPVDNPIHKVLEQGIIVGLGNHTLLVRQDGTLAPIDDSGAPIKDQDGNTTGVVIVFRDIAQRKNMEAEIESLAKFPGENPNPVLRIDATGVVQYANSPSADLLRCWNCSVGERLPDERRKLVLQTLKSGTALELEEDCAGRVYSLIFAPIVNRNYVNVYGLDISKRKQAEQALHESEERFRFVLSNSPVFVANLDRQLRYTWVYNPRGGFKPEDILGKTIGLSTDPESSAKLRKLLQDVVTQGTSAQWEATSRTSDGLAIFESHAEPLRDNLGQIIGATLMSIDITERKRAQQVLQQAHDDLELEIQERTAELKQANEIVDTERRRLTSLLNELPAYLILLTPDYKVSFANRFFEERFGKSQGRRCYAYLFNRTEPCEICETYTVLKTNESHRWEWTGPDHRNYDIYDFPFTDIDGSPLIMEVGLDITERKQNEAELIKYRNHLEELVQQRTSQLQAEIAERKHIEESLRELSYAVEQSPASIVITDVTGAIEYVNRKFCEVTQYTAEEARGQNPRILQSGRTPRPVYEQMWKTLTSGRAWRGEFLNKKKNGQLYWEMVAIAPMLDATGKITRYVAVKEDITERRKMEEALRESEQRFRLALAHAPVSVAAQDRDLAFIWAFNQRTVDPSQVIGKTDRDLFSPEDAERLIALKRQVLATGKPSGEQLWITSGGQRVFLDVHLEPLRDSSGKIFGVGIATVDLTELKLMEMQVRAQAVRIAVIADISERLSRAGLDIQSILDVVTQRVSETIGNACFIALMSDDGQWLTPRSLYAPNFPFDVKTVMPLSTLSVQHDLIRQAAQGQAASWYQLRLDQTQSLVKPEFWNIAEHCVGTNLFTVPMRAQGRTIGILGLMRFPTELAGLADEKSFLQDVADRAAIALVNAQLFDQIQRSHAELEQRVQERTESEHRQRVLAETMRDASFAFSRSLDLKTVFDELLTWLGHVIPFDSAAIMLLENESQIRIHATAGYPDGIDALSKSNPLELSAFPIVRQVIETQSSRCIADVRIEPAWKRTLEREHVVNWLGVPMIVGNRIIGMFSVHKREPGYFTNDHIRLTETLASDAAAAIQNAQLYRQVIQAQQQMETLSRELMEAEENERRAVARELHDEIGQVLTAVKTNLEIHRISTDAATQNKSLGESITIVDRALDQVRSLSLDLRPSILDEFGLVAALEWFLHRQAERHGFQVSFAANPPDLQPSPQIATVGFRVVQAALTNVVRHAHASQVQVTVTQCSSDYSEKDWGDSIELRVIDNGVGFNVDKAIEQSLHGQSMGLLGMQERVRLADGQFKIQSTPGHGTEILVRLPMGKKQA